MEELKMICTPFIVVAIAFTVAMLCYDLRWKRKNPWWRQDDYKMRLSPAERSYRMNERRRLNNMLMCWFAMLFMIFGAMVAGISAYGGGGFAGVGKYWFYLIPFIGGVFLALSGLHRRG